MESITAAAGLSEYVLDRVQHEGDMLVLHVHARKYARPSCPFCRHRKPWRHGRRTRRVSHLPIGGNPCDLLITTQRYRCPECRGTFTAEQPGVSRRARLTQGLRSFVNHLVCQLDMTVARLQSWLRISWATLWQCLNQPAKPVPDQLLHLCLDEAKFRKPRRFLTVLSNAESGSVIGLAEGRGYAPSKSLLQSLPLKVREQIETLATDLNAGQRKAAYDCLPNAAVCADLFHVVRLAKRAIREAVPGQRERTRCAVRQLLKALRARSLTGFQNWISEWQQSTDTLRRLHETLTKWEIEIENYIETGRTTGPAEALNRKIALLRRKACGYTNLQNFTKRIFLLNDSLHPEV